MAITIQVPLLNGDGSKALITLQLPQPVVGTSSVVWTSGTPANGTLVASQDGQSALFTPLLVGTTLITAVLKATAQRWQPRKLYRLNDKVLDASGHIQQVSAATRKVPSIFTPDAGKIPQGGDAANPYYNVSPIKQFGTVLNQDQGALSGDWPASAQNPLLTGAAAVTFVAGGFSGAGQSGISSPTSTGNDARVQIKDYNELGPGGSRTYIDAAGVTRSTGWVESIGSTTFSEPGGVAPAFSTSGGTAVDNELTWTDLGLAPTLVTYNGTTLSMVAGASAPFANYLIIT